MWLKSQGRSDGECHRSFLPRPVYPRSLLPVLYRHYTFLVANPDRALRSSSWSSSKEGAIIVTVRCRFSTSHSSHSFVFASQWSVFVSQLGRVSFIFLRRHALRRRRARGLENMRDHARIESPTSSARTSTLYPIMSAPVRTKYTRPADMINRTRYATELARVKVLGLLD
ncbi:hypothetical protein BJY04DRAFT_199083 [Aspergillus karnatakaensis]|uniref:uncharacterized protein n=1 Tax=Aspergillus karnatakaensis TaxID=1810916 RepID=UPI003CCDEA72